MASGGLNEVEAAHPHLEPMVKVPMETRTANHATQIGYGGPIDARLLGRQRFFTDALVAGWPGLGLCVCWCPFAHEANPRYCCYSFFSPYGGPGGGGVVVNGVCNVYSSQIWNSRSKRPTKGLWRRESQIANTCLRPQAKPDQRFGQLDGGGSRPFRRRAGQTAFGNFRGQGRPMPPATE